MKAPSTRSLVIWLALVCVAALAWSVASKQLSKPKPVAVSPEMKTLVDGNTAFAVDLYQQLKDQPGNLFFSPYSISTALGMTFAGARGETETEIARALHFDLPQNSVHAAFADLNSRLNSVQRWNRITVDVANSLSYQSDTSLLPSFIDLLREKYQAEVQAIDFAHDSQGASRKINQWVEERTHGKIKELTAPADLDRARIALCNAVYFKGKWKLQFDPSDTKPLPFFITETNQVTVEMMSRKAEVKAVHQDTVPADLLELPYYGEDLSMIILLPAPSYSESGIQQNSLTDVERMLTPENLQRWIKDLDKAEARKHYVMLPRFSHTHQLDLVPSLKKLGIVTAFGNTSDFSGMNGKQDLLLSKVLHQACVEVNEEGTEAAATTLMIAATKSVVESFVANHPFIFLIRDNATGSILFFGRVVDPTKQ